MHTRPEHTAIWRMVHKILNEQNPGGKVLASTRPRQITRCPRWQDSPGGSLLQEEEGRPGWTPAADHLRSTLSGGRGTEEKDLEAEGLGGGGRAFSVRHVPGPSLCSPRGRRLVAMTGLRLPRRGGDAAHPGHCHPRKSVEALREVARAASGQGPRKRPLRWAWGPCSPARAA